jgi:hypothetical protein
MGIFTGPTATNPVDAKMRQAAPLNARISREAPSCSIRLAAGWRLRAMGVLEWCRAAPAPFRDRGLSAPPALRPFRAVAACASGDMRDRCGDRGTKSKPIPGPHLVYGFLTTATPNAVVEPIHDAGDPDHGRGAGRLDARAVRSVEGSTAAPS